MRLVAAIALELGQYHQVHTGLLDAAAKVHDLVRIPEQWPYLPTPIVTPQPHAEINYQLLVNDFPEVAAVVRPHSLMTILQADPFPSVEARLVYYADKRANNATIVTLQQRIDLGNERWRVTPEQDRRAELLPLLLTLEQEIFRPIPYAPTNLQTHVTQAATPH